MKLKKYSTPYCEYYKLKDIMDQLPENLQEKFIKHCERCNLIFIPKTSEWGVFAWDFDDFKREYIDSNIS